MPVPLTATVTATATVHAQKEQLAEAGQGLPCKRARASRGFDRDTASVDR